VRKLRNYFLTIAKKVFLHPFLGNQWTQPFWNTVHRWSLYGLNIGYDCDVTVSGEINVLKVLGKSPFGETLTVFDVGANVGNYAQAVLDTLESRVELHCFEPTRLAHERLRDRFGSRSRVVINSVGLSSNEQTSEIFAQAPGSSRSSLYAERFESKNELTNESIRLTTLDRYCEDRSIKRIHLLKMDVEGHELEALKGASSMLSNGAVEWIQFEFGGCNLDSKTRFKDFYALLSSNYRLYRVLKNGLYEPTEYSERLEIYCTANYLAQRRSAGG
jgi:FkbM family methyltransferase